VVIGLVVIWATFYALNHNFLTPGNISNLSLQIAANGTISVGIVLSCCWARSNLAVAR